MREKKNKNDNVNDVNGKRDNKKAAGKFKNWTTALSMELILPQPMLCSTLS